MTTMIQNEGMAKFDSGYNRIDPYGLNESRAMCIESQKLIEESIKIINKIKSQL